MKDRILLCEYYECKGKCSKGKDADIKGYCQHCGEYYPQKGRVAIKNIKRQKQQRAMMRDMD